MKNAGVVCGAVVAILMATAASAQSAADREVVFDLAPQPLAKALNEFADQSNLRIVFDMKDAAGMLSERIVGNLTPRAALVRLLASSKLRFEFVDDHTVEVRRTQATEAVSGNSSENAGALNRTVWEKPAGMRVAQQSESSAPGTVGRPEDGRSQENKPRDQTIPEVLVRGARTLNMDIKRDSDGAQPYVIFDKEVITTSGASNLEDFLKQRLTMNGAAQSSSQSSSFATGNMSSINLRGLGANQTLILVDGHRMSRPVPATGTPAVQSDINGIPLGAIERVEVLPTTSSGLYGGGATGGVVNIVLRRDYEGVEFSGIYDDTFDGGGTLKSLAFNSGFSLEQGRTTVLLTASYSKRNTLTVGDREIAQKARARVVDNNGGNQQALNLAGIIPPLGSTPNIRSVNGSPLFGVGTPAFTSVPKGYVGGGGLAPLAANAGQYNLDLSNTAQTLGGARESLLNAPTVKAVGLTVRRDFTEWLQGFVEVGASDNTSHSQANAAGLTGFVLPATATTNPFGQAVYVKVPLSAADATPDISNQGRRAVGGILWSMSHGWRGGIDYTWDRSKYSNTTTPGLTSALTVAINSGALDLLRDPAVSTIDVSQYVNPPSQTSDFESTLKDATLRFAGPVGSLPAGEITLSTALEYLQEDLSDGYQFSTPTTVLYVPSRSQETKSAFIEARIPVVSKLNALPFAKEIEFQIAGRWDDFRVDGATGFVIVGTTTPIVRTSATHDSVNPTLGVKFRPVEDVMLRASWGTGFLAPAVNQITPSAPVASSGIVDPARGRSLVSAVFVTSGGNAGLTPEKSESWSAGLVLTPHFAPGVRASVDYTRIRKTENILGAPGAQFIVDNESLFPGRVTRGANLSTDPQGWAGPITAIDATATNTSRGEVSSIDASLDLRMASDHLGALTFYSVATWTPHFRTQLIDTAPERDLAGVTSLNPLKFKANAGLVWEWQSLTFGWNAQYLDSYLVADPTSSASSLVVLSQGSSRVSSQIYHDAFARFRLGSKLKPALLSNFEVQVGARNIFDRKPSFDAGNTNYYYSYFGDPRGASWYLSIKASL